jgi:hypothetical protein
MPQSQIFSSPFSYAKADATVGGVSLPYLNVGMAPFNAQMPLANTRTMIVLNTGANPLLVGFYYMDTISQWPAAFGGTGPNIIPTEGNNCVRLAAGSALTYELGSYEERGNMSFVSATAIPPVIVPVVALFPFSLLFFSSLTGPTTAYVTYINRLGRF